MFHGGPTFQDKLIHQEIYGSDPGVTDEEQRNCHGARNRLAHPSNDDQVGEQRGKT